MKNINVLYLRHLKALHSFKNIHINVYTYIWVGVHVQFSLVLKCFLKLKKWIHLQARKVKALTKILCRHHHLRLKYYIILITFLKIM